MRVGNTFFFFKFFNSPVEGRKLYKQLIEL